MTFPTTIARLCAIAALAAALCIAQPRDPGVRNAAADAGGPLPGLTADQIAAFNKGLADFQEVDDVSKGLGPRFNLDSCGGCHAFPAIGGASPAVNPQVAVASSTGATNVIPSFIKRNGPVREARFKMRPDGTRDGGVHALFAIQGRSEYGLLCLWGGPRGGSPWCDRPRPRRPSHVFGRMLDLLQKAGPGGPANVVIIPGAVE